jgi:glucosamine--fructose-6-phosphate aminotransferase (isomerizing)
LSTRRFDMFKAEKEIFSQYDALSQTYAHMLGMKAEIHSFAKANTAGGLTFIGCGSSYSLCKSASMSARMRLEGRINALAAGDLLIHFASMKGIVRDTVIVAPSRSGSSSEVVMAVKKAKSEMGLKCICICTRKDSELSGLSDLIIELPWAFDDSVCQTRTVTNLYFANLMLIALMADDKILVDELGEAVKAGKKFMETNLDVLKMIAENSQWDRIVVLADAELEGIAEEGALAFNEICQLPSNYYHVLDVRHGPMVLVDRRTLVIIACSPIETALQGDLIRDVKATGAYVVTVSGRDSIAWGSDCNILVPEYQNISVMGVPFIYVPQALSFYKALALGVNPDEPTGLESWIKL